MKTSVWWRIYMSAISKSGSLKANMGSAKYVKFWVVIWVIRYMGLTAQQLLTKDVFFFFFFSLHFRMVLLCMFFCLLYKGNVLLWNGLGCQ